MAYASLRNHHDTTVRTDGGAPLTGAGGPSRGHEHPESRSYGGTPMSEPALTPATFEVDGKRLEIERVRAREGNDGVKISSLLKETGLVTLDPGFMNTVSTESAITYIDGDQGILRCRGYPIEQLAEKSSFLETAYLLIYGVLPDAES